MPQTFSVIFAGSPAFAIPSLEALRQDPSFDVRLVVSQPDKPVGRKQVLTPPPVSAYAATKGIPCFQPRNINKELPGESIECDFLVVVAYGQILSEELLALPKIAPVNVHASLLPRWRGASPLQHALLAGDANTGVSIQKMVKALDAGDILAQRTVPIEERETIETLHDKLATQGALLLIETLKKPLHPVAQDTGAITVCSKLRREDGKTDLEQMTAEHIDRAVRALVPWPGVTCPIRGHTVKLLKTSLQEQPESIALQCAHNTILFVKELQPPGKQAMSATAWANGIQ